MPLRFAGCPLPNGYPHLWQNQQEHSQCQLAVPACIEEVETTPNTQKCEIIWKSITGLQPGFSEGGLHFFEETS